MGTEESSAADSRSSEILIAVSTPTSTDPVFTSPAIARAVSRFSTYSQLSIQDGSRLASMRQEFTASQSTVNASLSSQGIPINADE